MSNITVIVSGAGGLLGIELVRQLLDNDVTTIALTSNSKKLIKLHNNDSRLTVLDNKNWTRKINHTHIDILINCAFPRSSNPDLLAEGIDFTQRLIKEAIEQNIKNIINISSQSVYSQKNKMAPDEQAPVAPESLYAMAKYASEKIVSVLCDENNSKVNYSNIRLGSLVGVGLDARMINKFVKLALKGEKITVHGRGHKISYLDVKDAASALIAMSKKDPNTWDTLYNLGNNQEWSVLEIAKAVGKVSKKHIGRDVKIEIWEKEGNFDNTINSQKFYQNFDWKPKYNLLNIVEDIFQYYKENTTEQETDSKNIF